MGSSESRVRKQELKKDFVSLLDCPGMDCPGRRGEEPRRVSSHAPFPVRMAEGEAGEPPCEQAEPGGTVAKQHGGQTCHGPRPSAGPGPGPRPRTPGAQETGERGGGGQARQHELRNGTCSSVHYPEVVLRLGVTPLHTDWSDSRGIAASGRGWAGGGAAGRNNAHIHDLSFCIVGFSASVMHARMCEGRKSLRVLSRSMRCCTTARRTPAARPGRPWLPTPPASLAPRHRIVIWLAACWLDAGACCLTASTRAARSQQPSLLQAAQPQLPLDNLSDNKQPNPGARPGGQPRPRAPPH
jgi:hypothetical protein